MSNDDAKRVNRHIIIFAVCFISLKTTRADLCGEIYTDKQAVIKTGGAVFVQLMLLTV